MKFKFLSILYNYSYAFYANKNPSSTFFKVSEGHRFKGTKSLRIIESRIARKDLAASTPTKRIRHRDGTDKPTATAKVPEAGHGPEIALFVTDICNICITVNK